MLTRAEPIAFLATTNARRSDRFFREKLGLRRIDDDPFALVYKLGPTTLRVQKVERLEAQPFTVLGWHVSNLSRAVRSLTSRGVRFERWSGLGQDVDGIWDSPSGARVAWFKDPDGQILSLTQYPRRARTSGKG